MSSRTITVSQILILTSGLLLSGFAVGQALSEISSTFIPVAEDQLPPGTIVVSGADDPDRISMALAYDKIFRGRTYVSEFLSREGISYSVEAFFVDEVGLDDRSADVVVGYAQEGLAELSQIGQDQNAARCADRDQFETKAQFGERLKADAELMEIERARVWDGVFVQLDEANGERLRLYAAELRSSIVYIDNDPVISLQNSSETLDELLNRGCAATLPPVP